MISAIQHALMITGFVFVMMVVVEYVNVVTRGAWQEKLTHGQWGQYLLAAFLGMTPGCLGAFAAVAMYSHGILSLGAVVAAMIATSGDESFVMLAMIPQTALALFAFLFILGVVSGFLTDMVVVRRGGSGSGELMPSLQVHADEFCNCFPGVQQFLSQWRSCSAPRGTLSVLFALFLLSVAVGWIGPGSWNWIRVTILCVSAVGFFIVSTVPEHFLVEHLWDHVARKHVPRIFLWTQGTLIALYIITEQLQLGERLLQDKRLVLLFACLIGIIPESGPHLVFVTLYAQGSIPFSILLASSIVQDGHGMLPVLAHSRRQFVVIKAINLVAGLAVGALAMALGR